MKRKLFILCLLALMVFAAGCSSANPETNAARDTGAGYSEDQYVTDAVMPEEEAGWDSGESAPATAQSYGGHKIIKNANLGLETREFDIHVAHIKERAAQMGGYVASSNISGRKPQAYGDSGRYASLTIRIPQESMETFLQDTRALATVTYDQTGSTDITNEYTDTERRLDIYETQYERTMLLLEKAEEMEAIIALETELSRLTYEIESLRSQLTSWDDLVNFSTVYIEIMEIPPSTPLTTSNDTFGTRVSEGFQGTWNGILVFLEGLAVFLLAASPVLIPIAAIAIFLIIRYRRKKRGGKAPARGKRAAAPTEEAAQDERPPTE